ncbi:hypothetical protein FOZ62_007344 [Perkinsus olseni]|uniref:Uncharacterized protein n=1 Tax=Perkinsus olseni TaxID=32597 RepID=A0A7J6TYA4_PEROL|nr:hypothetical protein FOZ62_007344 [Perkinsus olseni]
MPVIHLDSPSTSFGSVPSEGSGDIGAGGFPADGLITSAFGSGSHHHHHAHHQHAHHLHHHHHGHHHGHHTKHAASSKHHEASTITVPGTTDRHIGMGGLRATTGEWRIEVGEAEKRVMEDELKMQKDMDRDRARILRDKDRAKEAELQHLCTATPDFEGRYEHVFSESSEGASHAVPDRQFCDFTGASADSS